MPFLIPLAVIFVTGIVYLAVSRKSSLKVRIAALGALALMFLTAIICLFIFFGDNSVTIITEAGPDSYPFEDPPAVKNNNNMALVLFIIFFIIMFLMVLIISIREQRRKTRV